jgi:integrase
MIIPFRRHNPKKCQHADKGRKHRSCKCPIWADGVLGNREIRLSLKTRDWNEAQRKIQRMEAEGRTGGRVLLSTAWDSLLADLEARGVTPDTRNKYKLLKKRMEAFAGTRRILYVSDCSVDFITSFRGTWKYGGLAALKHIERMRAFFRFCNERQWIDSNPAKSLKSPKIKVQPTMPLSPAEMTKLLTACEKYREEVSPTGKANALLLKAMILVMRYSGLRISDTTKLSVDRITDGKLFLFTQKTGQPVSTVLPPFVLKILDATPKASDDRYFWSCKGSLKTAVKRWQEKVRKVFDLAGVYSGDGHLVSHRLRDTFSVELLLSGVPLERVSVLLGHSSVRITERHYNPWVRSRQEQLEADVRKSWTLDPLQKGTKQVQSQIARPN